MNDILKWGFISASAIVFFYFLIPVNIYSSLLYLIAIVGAVLITFVLAKFLSSLLLKDLMAAVANQELTGEERKAAIAKSYNPDGCVIVFVLVFIFFASAFLMIFREVEMEKSELENYGLFTQATVKNGSSMSNTRYDFSNIVLGFKTAAGDSIFTKYSVSASEFDRYYKDQTLPIIYSSRYPSILKLARTPEEIEKYMNRRPQR